ncbi:hypothetical protein BC830DRAFT_817690 [Chytriomyces sp. MP71]|nr:hypothetical protein BC830DRAFT_817690 [Chytriomyces sp. MP71]
MDSGTANEIEGEVDKLATEARATLATAQTQRLKARAVEERVASVVTTQLRDLNSRVSAAVSKELERFVDAVALDLGQQTHTQQDRDALDALVRASLVEKVTSAASLGLEFELALGRFQNELHTMHSDIVTFAELHATSSIESRIDALAERIAWYLSSSGEEDVESIASLMRAERRLH